ncbi:MAG: tRNA (adenosine(37)-N6)-dimethylallyltransferase MiaA [Phycisphaerales bacterium]|nr:tRNA (adenosine(37)-N6)-dimethylallyltransferase MiaA [Phycisphaerales bacterium]
MPRCLTVPPHPTILILGPTAGGKTRLAIELAKRLPGGGTCICADSMQVYRGMDIGTAKPTPAEQAEAPHLLLDVADPWDDRFTVERWLQLARAAVEQVRASDGWPVLVGGTNLYVRAFVDGLFEGPEPDEGLRSELARMPIDALRRELERVDPVAARRIHPNDRRRAVRAVEVFRSTGQPISALQTQWTGAPGVAPAVAPGAAPGDAPRRDLRIIGLDYPIEVINRRINARVKAMMAAGLLEEVQRLHEAGQLGRQAREALGYKQLLAHLEGRWSLVEAVEQIKIRSRRYAKQQRTWLRRFRLLPGATFLAAGHEDTEVLVEKTLATILRPADAAEPREAETPFCGRSTLPDGIRPPLADT